MVLLFALGRKDLHECMKSTNPIRAFFSFQEISSLHFSMHATIASVVMDVSLKFRPSTRFLEAIIWTVLVATCPSRSCQVVRGAVCLTIRALCSDFGIAVISSWYRPLDAFFPLIDNFPFFEKRTSFSEKRICTLSFYVAEQIETRFTPRFGTYSTFFSIPV